MMRSLTCVAVSVFALSAAAQEPHAVSLTNPMVADVSQNAIEIRSDFNGTQLLIFGARNVPGDLIIAIRGPAVDVRLRRKERIAGMWMYVDQRRYDQLPLFYALAATKPMNSIASPTMLQALGLGEHRIISMSTPEPDEIFDKSLSHLMARKRWWQPSFGSITYFGESLFKVRLDLPDSMPSGDYTAEVYLFNRGKLVGFQTIPVTSYQVGFDAQVANAAKNSSLFYGLGAILMALFGGWLAHRLFHR